MMKSETTISLGGGDDGKLDGVTIAKAEMRREMICLELWRVRKG